MIDKHLDKLRARDDISNDEEQAIRAAVSQIVDLPADQVAIRAGDELSSSTLLLDGLMCRYKDLRNGQRQITELHVAGDFVDLHSFTLKHLDHNILTLTKCRIATVPHDNLRRITEQFPHLTRVLWFMTNLDAAIHREWEVSLGRRPAIGRLAHLFCEMNVRLGLVGLASDGAYPLPLTQTDLAECLGQTPVHINRTMQELRGMGLVEFRDGQVTIHDLPRLQAIAEFDPAYLYLERRPR